MSNLAELLEVFRTTPVDPDVMDKIPKARPSIPAKMGRPRIVQDPVNVRAVFERTDFDDLEARAKEQGISMKEAIRRAVRDWVDESRTA